jgi:WhiB family redox-sensing transcriptional regulator
MFFPPQGDTATAEAAKAVCALCPVRPECRQYALAAREGFGIWGGLDAAERESIARRRKRERARTLHWGPA